MQKKSFNIGWQQLFSTNGALSFVIALLCVGFINDSLFPLVSGYLTHWLGEVFGSLLLAALALILLLLFAHVIGNRITKQSSDTNVHEKSRPEARKALVLLVSKLEPSKIAINFHLEKLEYLWLFHSSDSEHDADLLAEMYQSQCVVRKIPINDVHDPLEYLNKAKSNIYESLPEGLEVEDVILDFTGMPKAASVGTVLAAREFNAPLQYSAAVKSEKGEQLTTDQPIQIDLQSRT